jgi:hypothetical protein
VRHSSRRILQGERWEGKSDAKGVSLNRTRKLPAQKGQPLIALSSVKLQAVKLCSSGTSRDVEGLLNRYN